MSLWTTVRFGANYVPSEGWYDGLWNGAGFAGLRADFSALADLGCDHVRVQLVWPWFHPEPGRISTDHLKRLARLLDEAEAFGLSVWPCLFTGWLSGFAFEPPFVERGAFFSPSARPFQEEYLDAIAACTSGHAALEGFDLGNEMNVVWKAQPSVGDAWLRWASGFLRQRLPGVPVVCGIDHNPMFQPDAFSAAGLAEATGVGIVHAYAYWTGAQERLPSDHPVVRRLGAYLARLFRALAREPRLPVWLQEFGQSASCWPEDDIPNLMEETVRAGVAEGVARFTWWASHDVPDGRGFHPFELDLGLLDLANRPKASGLRFRRLAEELSGRQVAVPGSAPSPPELRPEAVWDWLVRQANDDPIPID